MENEIVERVARALEPNAFATYDLGYTQQNSHDLRAFLNAEKAVRRARRKARIAIEAMREPTDAMQADGRDALLPFVGVLLRPVTDQWQLARDVHRAMIDAALKPAP